MRPSPSATWIGSDNYGDNELLFQIGKIFTSSRDMENLLQNVLNLLKSLPGIKRGMISIHDKETDNIVIDVSVGYSDDEISRWKYKSGEGITGRVIQTGQTIIVPSVSDEPNFLNRTGARSPLEKEQTAFLCVPIKRESETIGTIAVDKIVGEDDDFKKEINLLTIISIMIVHAVSNRSEHRKRESLLEQENELLRLELSERRRIQNIIGNSPAMLDLNKKILTIAPTNSTVLITGESGTGKELIANAIHENSNRKSGPFIKVNVASLPENLIESELFGHEKGAYTGAVSQKKGRFELAQGGTIFLDEIGDLSLHLQVKLLRVLQEKEIERLGGEKTIPLDVRIIAATHRNLEEKIESGDFRLDLYYRLNVFPVYSPPLRERKTDITLLTDAFLEKYCKEHGKRINRISSEAIDLLTSYHWPGNVRELENCIERAVILSEEDTIRSYHLPPSLQMATQPKSSSMLELMVEQYKKEIIIDHLKMCGGNITQTAKMLGTTKRILTYAVKQLDIDYQKYK